MRTDIPSERLSAAGRGGHCVGAQAGSGGNESVPPELGADSRTIKPTLQPRAG